MIRTASKARTKWWSDLALIALFTSWPFANFVGSNPEYGSYHIDTLWWFLGSLIVALGVYWFLRRVTNANPANIALSVSVVTLLFFNVDIVRTLLNSFGVPRFHTIAWGVCVVVLGYIALTVRMTREVYIVAFASGSVALLMAAYSVAAAGSGQPSREPLAASLSDRAAAGGFVERRNVYYFVFDGYGRDDQLAAAFGYDNSRFLSKLDELDFEVARASRSNYLTTPTSLSSTLSMQYLFPEEESRPKRRLNLTVSGDNETVRAFKKSGYAYIHAPGGGFYEISSKCNPEYADHCISANWRVSEITAAFFKMTPISTLLNLVELDSKLLFLMYSDLPRIIDELERYDLGDEPFFLFAHLLVPHDPIFDAECGQNRRWYERLEMAKEGHRTNTEDYLATLDCLNRQIENGMKALVERDPEAIIILQADHGFHYDLPTDPETWDLRQFNQRAGILNAFRLPERCREGVYEDLSSVNTFRLVLACLRGEKPDLLPDKSYLHWYGSSGFILRSDFQPR